MQPLCESNATAANAATNRLIDSWGRVHTNLRISVTDRCNLRCFYCMPADNVPFIPSDGLLSFYEIERFVRVVAPLGVDKLRITGGEPLVRPDVDRPDRQAWRIDGVHEIALTTNGILLAEQAERLQARRARSTQRQPGHA